MFNLKQNTTADLVLDFYSKQADLRNSFIKKLEAVIEEQRFKIAGFIEAHKVIEEKEDEAKQEEHAAIKALEAIKA